MTTIALFPRAYQIAVIHIAMLWEGHMPTSGTIFALERTSEILGIK